MTRDMLGRSRVLALPKRLGRRVLAAGRPAIAAGLALVSWQNPALASGARPVVVELFTSQGCSSCPPADALLGELARRPDVIALGFHVDYWDNLGWKDPLSAPGSTQRQRDYAQRFKLSSIYTPQMVIEGRQQMVGSDRGAVLDGITEAAPETAAPVSFDGDRHAVTIGAGNGSGEVLLVRFQRQRNTDVAQGENAGTRARDANGVTALTELGTWQGTATQFAITPPAENEGIAVLVQAPDGHMLGAGVVL